MQIRAVCGGGTESPAPRSHSDVRAPLEGVLLRSPGGALCLMRLAAGRRQQQPTGLLTSAGCGVFSLMTCRVFTQGPISSFVFQIY